MGKAENWQQIIIDRLNNENVCFLNPRRPDWDNNWEVSIDNPQFNQQVNWELEGLEKSDLILMYFDPNTKSPVSLIEFGLFAYSEKMLVCCPDGFWKKGNIDIVCKRYNIKQAQTFDKFILMASDLINKINY